MTSEEVNGAATKKRDLATAASTDAPEETVKKTKIDAAEATGEKADRAQEANKPAAEEKQAASKDKEAEGAEEDDLDDGDAEILAEAERNVQLGKRERKKVDYQKLNEELGPDEDDGEEDEDENNFSTRVDKEDEEEEEEEDEDEDDDEGAEAEDKE